ncbi:uncharacterized protein G2W53_015419 [Senna tora]|uniref:Uncharacterized protein n=1 Tax=Senna tora TaxID=362788 RepID=A0A835C820_9FABA|nr:uncharacterized protein G2W53_015419 [Senna tora]
MVVSLTEKIMQIHHVVEEAKAHQNSYTVNEPDVP